MIVEPPKQDPASSIVETIALFSRLTSSATASPTILSRFSVCPRFAA
jgi:hypothetical protein